MKLHALDRIPLVSQSHNHAVAVAIASVRAHFQFTRQRVFLDDEGMVASGLHWRRHIGEDRLAIVFHHAGLAMHQGACPDNFAAERSTDRLVSEANTEERHLAGKMLDQLNADAGILRRAWTRRDENAI